MVIAIGFAGVVGAFYSLIGLIGTFHPLGGAICGCTWGLAGVIFITLLPAFPLRRVQFSEDVFRKLRTQFAITWFLGGLAAVISSVVTVIMAIHSDNNTVLCWGGIASAAPMVVIGYFCLHPKTEGRNLYMDTPRIKMTYRADEPTPQNLFTDHDWLRHNQASLIEKYGECYIVIYGEQVLGTGETFQAALENAEQNLPPDREQITPICEWTGYPHPFLRVTPGKVELPEVTEEKQ